MPRSSSGAKNPSIEFGFPLDLTMGQLFDFYPAKVARDMAFGPARALVPDVTIVPDDVLDAIERAADDGVAL